MTISDEKLKDIEEWAYLLFSAEEISILAGLPSEEFCEEAQTPGTEIFLATKRGRLRAEAAIRKSIIEQAISGSSPAQNLAYQIIETTKNDEKIF